MNKFFIFSSLLVFASVPAFAQESCNTQYGGGYSCYNYSTGNTTTHTPQYGGGYSSYNYGTGSTTVTTPQYGGGSSSYNYGSGRTTTITPQFGGGFTID